MEPVIYKIIVLKAWESNRHLTGMPSHVKVLVDLQALKVEQSKLTETIFTKVMGGLADYFDTQQIGSGEMMEACIKELIALACKQNVDKMVKHVEKTVNSLKTVFKESSFGNGTPVRQDAEDAVHATMYMLQTNSHGEISRLSSNFQFLKVGIYDCWVQWNVGYSKRQIPPLQKLGPREFLFIDNICKMVAEKRVQRGRVDTSDISLGNIQKMYEAAVKELIIPGKQNQRVDQLKWQTMVYRFRKKIKQGVQGDIG
jgi:hypothetical protein